MRLTLLGSVLVLSLAASSLAQVPTTPIPIKKTLDGHPTDKVTVPLWTPPANSVLDRGEHPVAALTRVYLSGDGKRLTALATEILETLSCAPQFFELPTGMPCGRDNPQRRFNLSRDFVLLAWVGSDFSGKRIVYRIGVHQGLVDPYNPTLPGVTAKRLTANDRDKASGSPAIYEVFLSPSADADHSSIYVFTRQASPLETQTPGFVASATGPLFSSAAKLIGTSRLNMLKSSKDFNILMVHGDEDTFPQPAEPEVPPTVTAMMGIVKPPLPRAKVKVSDAAKQPIPVVDFQRQLTELAAKLRFVDVRQSICAMALASTLAELSRKTAVSTTCTTANVNDCRDLLDKQLRAAAAESESACRAQMEKAVRAEAGESQKPDEAAIRAETTKRFDGIHKAPLGKVDDEFRKLIVAQQPEKITGDSSFANTPLTHWSFGALTSFATRASASKSRIKVGNDGKLVSDPMPRQMTLFVMNWSIAGFDPDGPRMSMAERVRPFVGVIATPDFGLGGGLSIGIWRGVGLNLGAGVTWIATLRPDEQLGGPPSDTNAPFATGVAKVLYVGASYNFGK